MAEDEQLIEDMDGGVPQAPEPPTEPLPEPPADGPEPASESAGDPEVKTYTLRAPVTYRDRQGSTRTIATLTLMPLCARHLWHVGTIERPTFGEFLRLQAARADVDVEAMRLVSFEDTQALTEDANEQLSPFATLALGPDDPGFQAPPELNSDKPYTIQLQRPVREGQRVVSHLTLKPLIAGHLWDIDVENASAADMLKVGARQCGESELVVGKLRAPDCVSLIQAVRGYFRARPA